MHLLANITIFAAFFAASASAFPKPHEKQHSNHAKHTKTHCKSGSGRRAACTPSTITVTAQITHTRTVYPHDLPHPVVSHAQATDIATGPGTIASQDHLKAGVLHALKAKNATHTGTVSSKGHSKAKVSHAPAIDNATLTQTISSQDLPQAVPSHILAANNATHTGTVDPQDFPQAVVSHAPTTDSIAYTKTISPQDLPQAVISHAPTTDSAAMSSYLLMQSMHPEAMETSTPELAPLPSQQDDSSNETNGLIASTNNNNANTASTGQSALGFRTKRGIIASGKDEDIIASSISSDSKISWLADWFSAPPKTMASHLTFVPQNYGKDSDNHDHEWTRNADKAAAAGSKYFLSFGEPGTPNDKLHMEPAEAVALWRKDIQRYVGQGITVGAPGTLQNPQDFAWLEEFLHLCTDCKIGFLAMHWFDKPRDGTEARGLKDMLARAIKLASTAAGGAAVPVWLDNFQFDGTREQQKAFLQDMLPWLDGNENIQAYAYVPPEKAGFVGDDGKLNDLAKVYATA